MKVAVGASDALRSLYGTKYTSGPGATTICKYSTYCSCIPPFGEAWLSILLF